LRSEEIAELEHKSARSGKSYRIIAVRKNLSVERGEDLLFAGIRYFFYITNERSLPAEQVVSEVNSRCNSREPDRTTQERREGATRVSTLEANWARRVMCSLAWTLQAWMALLLPVSPRRASKHQKALDFRSTSPLLALQTPDSGTPPSYRYSESRVAKCM
jgi:hypothetical protein